MHASKPGDAATGERSEGLGVEQLLFLFGERAPLWEIDFADRGKGKEKTVRTKEKKIND